MKNLNSNLKYRKLISCVSFIITVIIYAGSTPPTFAQGILEDENARTAVIQYTMKYRFSPDIEIGDYVKYQTKADEGENPEIYELRVTKKDKTNFWIEEKVGEMETHYLFDPVGMKLVKAHGTDDKGQDYEITPLSEEKLAEVMTMIRKQMELQGSKAQIVNWIKGDKTEEINIEAGSFTCSSLVPEYSKEYSNQTENYRTSLRSSGKSEEEIDKMIFGNAPALFFSEDVPRMLPVYMAIGWMPWIDSFGEVKGGLVESRNIAPLKLTGYSK